MARRKSTKRIRLLRALLKGTDQSLQQLVDRAVSVRRTVAEREVSMAQFGIVRIQIVKRDRRGLLIHVVSCTPGESATTIGLRARREQDDERPNAPPDGRAFKHGDAFALISANHLLLCSDGILAPALAVYLRGLFVSAGLDNATQTLDFMPLGDRRALRRLHGEQFKEIRLATTLEEAELAHVRDAGEARLWASFAKSFKDRLAAILFRDGAKVEAQMSEVQVAITVKVSGGVYGDAQLLDAVTSAGGDLIDADDPGFDYTILTRDNFHITPDTIRITKPVGLERLENQDSLSAIEVWDKILDFFDELVGRGVLRSNE